MSKDKIRGAPLAIVTMNDIMQMAKHDFPSAVRRICPVTREPLQQAFSDCAKSYTKFDYKLDDPTSPLFFKNSAKPVGKNATHMGRYSYAMVSEMIWTRLASLVTAWIQQSSCSDTLRLSGYQTWVHPDLLDMSTWYGGCGEISLTGMSLK